MNYIPKALLLSLFSIMFFSCKKEKRVSPPEIKIVTKSATIPVLSPVNFCFEVHAEGGLEKITIKHVLQDALITKSSGFTSATFDQINFGHNTGFESINKTLKYELRATDKLKREALEVIEIKVDNSSVNLFVEDTNGPVTSFLNNQSKVVNVKAISTSSLFSLSVYQVLKDGTQELLFFRNNIQLLAADFLQKDFTTELTITPNHNIREYRFDVEDNAKVKQSLVIPVQ